MSSSFKFIFLPERRYKPFSVPKHSKTRIVVDYFDYTQAIVIDD